MENSNTRAVHVAGRAYEGFRETRSDGTGYIEFHDPDGGPRVARVDYHGQGVPTDVTTYGNTLPRPVLEHLLELADDWLA